LAIVFSEQIAGFVPKGTHMWEKFVSPEKLESILESSKYEEIFPVFKP
jgi:polyprenyldihydroxybenzoate methyltransferase/3-demethylubiquinol 3-O-methyltransferase